MNILLPKIVAIGIYNSQVAVKGKTITRNRTTTMFEIELPIEKGGISYIDSESNAIETDTLICARPGQIRHSKLPYKCYYIHMILKEGALFDALMQCPSFIKTNKTDKYIELFTKLCKHYGYGLQADEIKIQSLILELIHNITNDSEKQTYKEKMKNGNYEVIEKTVKYIKNNLTDDLSLEMLSKMAGFSPIYFHNCFKTSTGMTLHSFIELQRINKAKNLLVTTDYTLTQISEECGFSSQSYFSYAFKKMTSLTPRQYVKKIFSRYDN